MGRDIAGRAIGVGRAGGAGRRVTGTGFAIGTGRATGERRKPINGLTRGAAAEGVRLLGKFVTGLRVDGSGSGATCINGAT